MSDFKMEGYAFIENERLETLLKLEKDIKNKYQELEDQKIKFIKDNSETIIFRTQNSPLETMFHTRFYIGKDETIKKLIAVNKNLQNQVDILSKSREEARKILNTNSDRIYNLKKELEKHQESFKKICYMEETNVL